MQVLNRFDSENQLPIYKPIEFDSRHKEEQAFLNVLNLRKQKYLLR